MPFNLHDAAANQLQSMAGLIRLTRKLQVIDRKISKLNR
jgi:hypothetical protein